MAFRFYPIVTLSNMIGSPSISRKRLTRIAYNE